MALCLWSWKREKKNQNIDAVLLSWATLALATLVSFLYETAHLWNSVFLILESPLSLVLCWNIGCHVCIIHSILFFQMATLSVLSQIDSKMWRKQKYGCLLKNHAAPCKLTSAVSSAAESDKQLRWHSKYPLPYYFILKMLINAHVCLVQFISFQHTVTNVSLTVRWKPYFISFITSTPVKQKLPNLSVYHKELAHSVFLVIKWQKKSKALYFSFMALVTEMDEVGIWLRMCV